MDNLRKIADELLMANSEHRQALFSLISTGETIAFIGAGFSANPSLKYPSWDCLLEKLFIAANRIATFTYSSDLVTSPLEKAEAIHSHFLAHAKVDEFKSLLSREFSPKPSINYTKAHELLVKLPFRAFVTTNYDACIEHALNNFGDTRYDIATYIKPNARHMLSRFLRSTSDSFSITRRYVAHLHGWFDDPDSIILTASQYYQAYGFRTEKGVVSSEPPQITLHRQLAWALLATRKLVFFGCSMEDPYITELLKIVAIDLWESNQCVHFVVLPLESKSLPHATSHETLFRSYGLQVVYYDNLDGTFTNLDKLLTDADAYYTQNKPSAWATRDGEASAKLVKQTTKIPLSWLDEVNEFTTKDLKQHAH